MITYKKNEKNGNLIILVDGVVVGIITADGVRLQEGGDNMDIIYTSDIEAAIEEHIQTNGGALQCCTVQQLAKKVLHCTIINDKLTKKVR